MHKNVFLANGGILYVKGEESSIRRWFHVNEEIKRIQKPVLLELEILVL